MEKQRWEESRRRRKEVRRSAKRKREKKEEAGARKGRKVAIHYVFFPMICGSGGSKSMLAIAAGAEPCGEMTNCGQNVQITPGSEHFWRFRCRKSVCCCGAKHISKFKVPKPDGLGPILEVAMCKNCTPMWHEAHFEIKCAKHTNVGPLLEVKMSKSARRCGTKHVSKPKVLKTDVVGPLLEVVISKKCTPLCREARFQAKCVKNWRSRTNFGSCDVQKLHADVARSTFRNQNVQNTPTSDQLRCRKSARRCGAKHISKSNV